LRLNNFTFSILLLTATAGSGLGGFAFAQEASAPLSVASFVQNNCIDCHDGPDGDGGFDVAEVADGLTPANVDRWVRVFDRVHDGEMPPPEDASVDKKAKREFVKATSEWIKSEQAKEFAKNGRVPSRRLTNLQLERTLQDLLAIDVPLSRQLPEEPRTNGFTGIAFNQSISHFQLEQHLGVVDAALDAAFGRVLAADQEDRIGWTKMLPAEKLARSKRQKRCREPELIDRSAVTWHSTMAFYGRLPATTAPADGWYRFKIKAKALNPKIDNSVWCTVRSGPCVANAPVLDWIQSIELGTSFQEFTCEAWLNEGDKLEIKPYDRDLKVGKFKGGQVDTGVGAPQNLAGVAIKSIEMSRFFKNDEDKAKVAILSKMKTRMPSKAAVKRAKARREKNRKKKIDAIVDLPEQRVITTDPVKDLKKLVARFAQRSFRRRASKELLDRYAELAVQEYERSKDFVTALRLGYRAVLCSPRFMYFREKPGELDDFEIASRLSYMLWNRMPDPELFGLADKGKLNDAKVIEEQVDRMLKDPKGASFAADFADQWLDISQIDFTQPDRRMFGDYDPVVQQAMVDETITYLDNMIQKNLGVKAIVDSNFTFVNSRLARYYRLKSKAKIKGDEIRRIKLSPEDHRGGLVSQGAIMKVTANGTATSPVVRGVWISERLLGVTIPPPPSNVPAVEPDIRGAKTMREVLAKHMSDASCASCHRKVDPPGFALEVFDPTGRYRTRYPKPRKNKKAKALAVNASGKTADGVKFKDFDEFKKIFGKRSDQLAHNVVEKLLVYGTGARLEFADRDAVEACVKAAKKSNYGFRTLIKKVVTSDVFLNK
jgi:hypothetical protein